MKKIVFLMICVILLCSAASADIIGTINTTDIKAFINYMYIPTYNFNGMSVVFVRDLERYGYTVDWRAGDRSVVLYRGDNAGDVQPLTWQYITSDEVLKKLYDVYDSDIVVYFANGIIPSYNINGKVAVALRDIDIFCNIEFDNNTRTASLRVGMDELGDKEKEYVYNIFYKNEFLLSEGDYYHIKVGYMIETGEYDKKLMKDFKGYIDRLSESIEEFREYEEPDGFSESAMEIWWAVVNGRYASANLYDMGENVLNKRDDPNLYENYYAHNKDSKYQRVNAMRILEKDLKNLPQKLAKPYNGNA